MTTIPTSQTAAPTTSTNGGVSIGSTTVDKNMFLKLLVAQMQNQDPMQPKDDSAWMSQMAQFSEVEQISNLASSNDKIASSLRTSQTLSLIGHTVSYTDQSGAPQQGVVDKVQIAGGSATLDVAGTSIDASAVTEVR
jgi:flagellar basal-body rod modification protein FlgD